MIKYFNLLKKLIKFTLLKVKDFYKIKIIKDTDKIIANQWFNDNGDSTHRLKYPIKENGIVFDVGGYKGEWSEKIIKLYNPHIYIFEPSLSFYSIIKKKFESNPKILTFNFGFSDKEEIQKLSVLDNGSSVYRKGERYEDIYLKDIYDFIIEKEIPKIDLMKINIEGGEYLLLNRMIEMQIINKCENIQVQFHRFYKNSDIKRDDIRIALMKTHFLTYDYPFVWENWQKKQFV